MSVTVHQVPYTGGANGQVYPITDRRIIDYMARKESGVVVGCEVTNGGGNTLNISSGWGIASGCVFTIANESVTAALSASGSHTGELILVIDTTAGTGSFRTTAGEYPSDLEQDDLTAGDGVYEILFATYAVSTSAIVGTITQRYPTLEPEQALPFQFGIDNNGNYGYIKNGTSVVTPFDPWAVLVPVGYALTSNDGIKALSGGSVSAGSAYGAYIIANVGGLGYTTVTRTGGQGAIKTVNYDGTSNQQTAATLAIDSGVKWVLVHRTASSQGVLSVSFT